MSKETVFWLKPGERHGKPGPLLLPRPARKGQRANVYIHPEGEKVVAVTAADRLYWKAAIRCGDAVELDEKEIEKAKKNAKKRKEEQRERTRERMRELSAGKPSRPRLPGEGVNEVRGGPKSADTAAGKASN